MAGREIKVVVLFFVKENIVVSSQDVLILYYGEQLGFYVDDFGGNCRLQVYACRAGCAIKPKQ